MSIYAVYNEQINCIGIHKVSNRINCFDSTFFHEGLAMFFDRAWWGVLLKNPSFERLLDNAHFDDDDCRLTYPIVGAFVNYLVTTYGKSTFLDFWQPTDNQLAQTFLKIYHKSIPEMETEFKNYLNLFSNHPYVDLKIKELLEA